MNTTTMNHGTGTQPGKANRSSKRDWGLFFGGLLMILIGLIVFFWPGLTLVMIATLAGLFLLAAGIFDIVAWARMRKVGTSSGWALVNAFCNIVLGVLFIFHPIVTSVVIPWVAGIFVIGYGIFAIIAGVGLRKAGPGWGIMFLNGIISVLCGIMFILWPESFVIFLAVFLMMRGITMCTFGIIAPNSLPYV